VALADERLADFLVLVSLVSSLSISEPCQFVKLLQLVLKLLFSSLNWLI